MLNTLDRFWNALPRPITPVARALLALAVIPLVLSFTQPLWNIQMFAPQYPKGLQLDIYAYTIKAGNDGTDLQEINTLNHYIGMRKLDRAEFTDLTWIPFAIGALALLTLRVAAIGDVRSLLDLAVLTLYFSAFSAARFIFQLYTYGHELDPTAPIKMEGFMPAIIGTKQIANFTTSSWPRGASFLIGLFAATVVVCAVWQVFRPSQEAATS